MKPLTTILLTVFAGILTSCSEKGNASAPLPDVSLPAGLALAESPEDVIYLTGAYQSVNAGETVSIQAIVDENGTPFNATYAIMTVTNKSGQKVCCPSCLDADVLKATVQVLDGNGKVLKKSLEGFQGLAPGMKVTVIGKVDPNYKKGANLVINATGLFVQSGS